MRIACIYLPAFPLQVVGREGPHRVGRPVAVATAGEHPRVVAVSTAARARGARSGVTAAKALQICPDLEIVLISEEQHRRSANIAAELIAATAEAVELPRILELPAEPAGPAEVKKGSGAARTSRSSIERDLYFFARLPPRLRGTSFGRRVLTSLARHGFRGRVGIADDRFTAKAASRVGHGDPNDAVTMVSRGGSAAFLAPLPLGLLPIEPDVERMLRGLGVETIGAFAALPPPKVSSPVGIDLIALARGAGPAGFRPTRLPTQIEETIELPLGAGRAGDGAGALERIDAREGAVHTLARRLSDRLGHRGTGARTVIVSFREGLTEVERELSNLRPVTSETRLFELLWPILANAASTNRISIAVTEFGEPSADDATLFDRAVAPSTEALDAAIERLEDGIAHGFSLALAPSPGLTATAPREPRKSVRANRVARPERTRRARPTGPNQPRLRGFRD